MKQVKLLFLFCLSATGFGKPQYLKMGTVSTSSEANKMNKMVLQSESSGESENSSDEVKEALKELPDSKAALLEMKVKDKKTNKTKTQNFLYLPKSFQYTITNCFCGGNCQEIHDPDVWKCNDT